MVRLMVIGATSGPRACGQQPLDRPRQAINSRFSNHRLRISTALAKHFSLRPAEKFASLMNLKAFDDTGVLTGKLSIMVHSSAVPYTRTHSSSEAV